MRRHQCQSCQTVLFLEEDPLWDPRCPQCRSSARHRPGDTPQDLAHFACVNCATAFLMKATIEPHTCPKCNAFRFQKSPYSGDPTAPSTEQTEEVRARHDSLDPHEPRPLQQLLAEQPPAQEASAPGLRLDVLLIYTAAMLLPVGAGYLWFQTTGAIVGAVVGLVAWIALFVITGKD